MSSLVLASGSPQRRAILEQLGLSFEVIVSDAVELASGPPEEVALENAYRKASAVAGGLRQSRHAPAAASAAGGAQPVVIGCDTVVALGARLYGKPRDEVEAATMHRALNGATHRVISGLCVIEGERTRTAAATTTVSFRRCDDAMLDWYLATGEWRERAGGYAIQGRGAALVTRIEGDYLNVVGLPVPTLLDLLPDLFASRDA